MNEKMRYAALFFAALFLLAGCTGVSKEAAFSEVQQQVDESIGFTVHWNGDTDSAGEVTQTIEELLSESLVADAAVQIALLNNRRLQATYEEIGIAYAAVVEAGSLSNPAFHGGATFGLPQDPMTAHPAHDSYVFEIEMDFLSVLVWIDAKIRCKVGVRGGKTPCDGCCDGFGRADTYGVLSRSGRKADVGDVPSGCPSNPSGI